MKVIAHRGASGLRPEHTRVAYDLAIDQGADFIEPDLVMSRDGYLIVRHDADIGETTDVSERPEFADRRAAKVVDGREITGWFAEDFTLAELKTLRARERLPDLRPGNTAFDRQESILTFAEVLEIARQGGRRTGRAIGVCPELKHPSHFAGLGLPIEDAFVEAVRGADVPLLVQCFEVGALQRLAARIDTPLLQLIAAEGGPADRPDLRYADMITADGLGEIAAYAAWIGVEASMVPPSNNPGPASLVTDAHAAGLKVAAWTLRAENAFLPVAHRQGDAPGAHGNLAAYAARLAEAGIDAVFTDFPALARAF